MKMLVCTKSCMNVHSSFTQLPKRETIQVFSNWWTENKCGISIQGNIIWQIKWSADTCYKMDEASKRAEEGARCKRPGTVWLHVYGMSRTGRFLETKSRLVVVEVTRGEWEWGEGRDCYWTSISFLSRKCSKLIESDGGRALWIGLKPSRLCI